MPACAGMTWESRSPHKSMNPCRLLAHALGAAEERTVGADPLVPVVQPEHVGDADAAVHFGRGARDEAARLTEIGFCMRSDQRRLVGPLIERVSRVPDQRPSRLQLRGHLRAQML